MLVGDLFINKELSEKYRSEGYVTLQFLDGVQISDLYKLYDASASQAGVNKQFFTSIWSDNIEYRRLTDTKIKELLAPAALNYIRDIKPVFANFMVKNTGEGTSLMPHQDWSFVEEPEHDSATIWCPLVDVDSINGTLQVIPRSHRISNYTRARFLDRPFDGIDSHEMEAMMIDIPLRAGEAIILNSRLIHASPCNYSDKQRVAASLVIAPEAAPLFHWIYNPKDDMEIKKLAVTPDFFWQYSCYEYPDSVTAIESCHHDFKDLSLETFREIIGYERSLITKKNAFCLGRTYCPKACKYFFASSLPGLTFRAAFSSMAALSLFFILWYILARLIYG